MTTPTRRSGPARQSRARLASRLAAYSATASAVFAAPAQAAFHTITTLPGSPFIPTYGTGESNVITAGVFEIQFYGLRTLHDNWFTVRHPGASVRKSNRSIDRLALNVPLQAGNFAFGGVMALRVSSTSNGNPYIASSGQWQAPAPNGALTGYIGLKQLHSGYQYFGWLRVKILQDSGGNPMELSFLPSALDSSIYGAYDTAGSGIKSGQISAVPEPTVSTLGGLALLSLGAVGLREHRRRRAANLAN